MLLFFPALPHKFLFIILQNSGALIYKAETVSHLWPEKLLPV